MVMSQGGLTHQAAAHSKISHWQATALSWLRWFTVAMPKRRLPSMQRRTSSRYRGSKMFSSIFSPAFDVCLSLLLLLLRF